jgi:serine/threonine protein kinase
MGSVWLAEHAMLGRRAAIKVLHTEFSSRPEFVQRFFNEARAATAIEDPGIVQIFDFGQHTDGSAYIVMELLDGETIDKRLQRVGTLELSSALRIMRQIASTLGAAHARGIVHRDIKPENLFMVRDPEVNGGERAKVLDFGIAKLTADSANKVKTQTSAVMGTPTYMSPEQCRGAGHVDQRSDIYALGCVLFHLLVGRPPFVSEGIGDLIVMHMTADPPVPSTMRQGGLPPEVDQIILRCLAKNPAHRFNSASDLAVALGALTGSSPMHGGFTSQPGFSQPGFPSQPGIPPEPGFNSRPGFSQPAHQSQAGHAQPASVPTTLSLGTNAIAVAPAKKSNGLVIGIAGVLVIGGVVGVVLATRGGGKTPDPPAVSSEPANPTVTAAAAAPAPAPTPEDGARDVHDLGDLARGRSVPRSCRARCHRNRSVEARIHHHVHRSAGRSDHRRGVFGTRWNRGHRRRHRFVATRPRRDRCGARSTVEATREAGCRFDEEGRFEADEAQGQADQAHIARRARRERPPDLAIGVRRRVLTHRSRRRRSRRPPPMPSHHDRRGLPPTRATGVWDRGRSASRDLA